MSLRHMTVGQKLTAAFSLFFLMLFLIGGFSLYEFDKMNDTAIDITDSTVPSIVLAADIRDASTNLRRFEFAYLLLQDNPQRAREYQQIIDTQSSKMTTLLQQYETTLYDDTERAIFEQVKQHWSTYMSLHASVWQGVASGQRSQAVDALLGQGYNIFNQLSGSIRQLVERNNYYAQDGKRQVGEAFQIARTSIITAILVCAALVVLFATVLTRQIRNPLVMLTNQASRIADGQLGRGELCDWIADGRLNRDEIGQLGQAIQRMKNGLGDLVSEISSSVTQLGSAVEEVSAISTQSSQGMSQQQGQITQVATAMQQMQTTVEDVARNTTQAAEMARSAFNASRQGQQVVVSAIDSLEKMAGEIEGTGQVVSQLESESNNISLVLDVIRNIADQTNLLALNAAIEAARAGEQGRGFAVVADEVRTLAQRTQDSTTEIQRMIEQLQSRASAAGSAMQEGCQSMLETVSLARGAGEQMEQVNDAVTAISDMNTQIASATEEQHQVAEELGRNMVAINTVAEENAQGANHTAQSCHELAQLAQHLQQRISRFSLA